METNFSKEQLKDKDNKSSEKIFRKCVHCGFCNATCPTYQLLGDELDGPRGRIYLIKDMLELLGIKYDEAYVSINDFFVSESSSEYSIFIIDTDINEDSTDIQFWMQLGAYLSQSSENYLFISSFDQSISVPDIYKDKILKLESSGNDQIFAQILKYLINTSVIDVNLT